ncbi:DUF1800 family protein [Sphingomonas sp. SUN039]|uniref:DUF1800 domain-containing protein n=1 Tax=Sphingomonas sp. SUN039 TaxID=2937787 RepID=UPI0021640ED2|nr:DUF1800 domain-containing protein [Sphingomonas sp. SUN039]UVO54460.1 DUF1800 domain-containing protein [Sphingomonas sp. SUN039]
MTDYSTAANRFGFGVRPDDAPVGDARRALLAQFDRFDVRPAAFASAPTRATVAQGLADYLEETRAYRQQVAMLGGGPGNRAGTAKAARADTMAMDAGGAPTGESVQAALKASRKYAGQVARSEYIALVGARANAALTSPAPFVERMVHFWANHFAISIDKLPVIGMGGLLEVEAIRPHVLGRFADMLLAVETHPAMLLYLDQAQSIGPTSRVGTAVAARGRRKIGLNENLAREIMELHTLGVRTGYTQADVTEFARAMTGWSVAGITRGPMARFAEGQPGAFLFAPALHEPGSRTIMGRRYDQDGEGQARAVLADLAASPATATHIATKLARHFTGDTPPPALVARLSDAFLKTGGDLPALYRILIDAPETAATGAKFKTPWDWSISALRAVGTKQVEGQAVAGLMNQLGQPVWKPGSPAGWDDLDASWAGPDALLRRVEAASRLATRAGGAAFDPRALAAKVLPGGGSAATLAAVGRAESPVEGLALVLVAPEFMRR